MDRRANERAAHAYIAVMISALCHSYTVRNKHNTVESKTNYGPNAALITRTHVRYMADMKRTAAAGHTSQTHTYTHSKTIHG